MDFMQKWIANFVALVSVAAALFGIPAVGIWAAKAMHEAGWAFPLIATCLTLYICAIFSFLSTLDNG